MTGASNLVRGLLIYSICVPLAIFLGYLIAQPADMGTILEIGFVLFLLALPILLRWHHLLLVASWNMMATLFFLPGRPFLWLATAWFGFCLAIVQYVLSRRRSFLPSPSITRPLVFFVILIAVTAKFTGGIGLHSFGSETQGGKRYILLFSSVVGYFALTSQTIPRNRANLYVALYFLGAITASLGELAPFVPQALYFIFLVFPVTEFGYSMVLDPGGGGGILARLSGVAMASSAALYALLARFGISGLLELRRPFRLLVFLMLMALTLLGGFRSSLILLMLVMAALFCLEGLFKSRLLPVFILTGVLGATLLVSFVDRLPLSMQRTVSFLPLPVDPIARMSAEASTEWRVEIWKQVVKEVPRYLFLGKGYAMNVREADAVESLNSSTDQSSAVSILSGDYHNGPLTVIIPFGILGVVAFLWFTLAGFRVLWSNYRHGDPEYRHLNAFLLAYYFGQIVLFLAVFGSLYSDFAKFTGLIGLSVSLNGGVAKRVTVPPVKIRYAKFQPRARAGARPEVGAASR